METAADRVQFALRFAQMNLDTLSPGRALTLREDLEDFLCVRPGKQHTVNPGGMVVAGLSTLTPPLPQDYSEDAMRQLQQETLAIFSSVVDSRTLFVNNFTHDVSQGWVNITGQFSLSSFPDLRKKSSSHLMIKGPTRDVFLMTLLVLLNHEPTDRILRCPECHTIFYRVRKQQYCSRPCTNRANVRQWRQEEGNQGKEQEQAHARYLKKQPLDVQSKVKRRPRTRSTRHGETREQ